MSINDSIEAIAGLSSAVIYVIALTYTVHFADAIKGV